MPFKEDIVAVLEKVEDVLLRETLLNELELAHAADTAGLVENRDTLKNEKTAMKAKLDEVNAKLETSGGDKTTFMELQEKIKNLTANPGDQEKFKEIEKRQALELKQLKEESENFLKKREADLLDEQTKNFKLNEEINAGLCKQALSRELDKANVLPAFKEILMKGLATDVYITEVEGERKVKFKYAGINYDIDAGMTSWAKDASNKQFISAKSNMGAGAQGSKGTDTYANRTYASLTLEEKTHLFKTDKPKYDAMKARG